VEKSDVTRGRNVNPSARERHRRNATGDSFKIIKKKILFTNNDEVINSLTSLSEDDSRPFSVWGAVTKEE
jgi:hypothetical protein